MKPETELQINCVSYLSLLCKNNNFLFFSVPNEGLLFGAAKERKNQFAKMMILKKMGMTPGVNDLFIMKKGNSYCVEFKSDDGELSINQVIFKNHALVHCTKYKVIKTFKEFEKIIKKWRIV